MQSVSDASKHALGACALAELHVVVSSGAGPVTMVRRGLASMHPQPEACVCSVGNFLCNCS